MKLVCISDTHMAHGKLVIPECDVLIHAGDWTHRGTIEQIAEFAEWFRNLDQAGEKICIPGNHDIMVEKHTERVRAEFPAEDGVHLLIGESVLIDGVSFWGDPHTPRFGLGYAFQLDRGRKAAAHWAKMPSHTNVAITHGPPIGYGDRVPDADIAGNWSAKHPVMCNAGDASLLARLHEVRPQYHICGHLHGGYGVHRHLDLSTVVVNAAVSADRNNQANFNPIVLHI